MAKNNKSIFPSDTFGWVALFADYLFPGSGSILKFGRAVLSSAPQKLRQRVESQSRFNAMLEAKKVEKTLGKIDGTHNNYLSRGTWSPGAANNFRLDVMAAVHTVADAMVATLDSQSPFIDQYSVRGNVNSDCYFEVTPILLTLASGGAFTPQVGTVNPMNPHSVIAAAVDAEYRYLVLKPFRAKLIADGIFSANYSYDIKDFANAYLSRKQSSEFSGDDVGIADLLFLVAFNQVDQTGYTESVRHVLWHAQ